MVKCLKCYFLTREEEDGITRKICLIDSFLLSPSELFEEWDCEMINSDYTLTPFGLEQIQENEIDIPPDYDKFIENLEKRNKKKYKLINLKDGV